MIQAFARLRARLVSSQTDWSAEAFPTTPKIALPPDQGDAASRPSDEQLAEARRALRAARGAS